MNYECKCYANYYGNVVFCPLHAAAEDMYEVLSNLVNRIDGGLALGEKADLRKAREVLKAVNRDV